MTRTTARARIIELLGGDASLLEALERAGIVPPGSLTPEQVEQVLVARTLLYELDVNLPGVEVILRLRSELLKTRAQVTRLTETLVRDARRRRGGR